MTPHEPRHEKTCLGTDHLSFWWASGGGGGGLGFFLKILFFFLIVREPKYIFQDKAKTFFFFLTGIYARNVFF